MNRRHYLRTRHTSKKVDLHLNVPVEFNNNENIHIFEFTQLMNKQDMSQVAKKECLLMFLSDLTNRISVYCSALQSNPDQLEHLCCTIITSFANLNDNEIVYTVFQGLNALFQMSQDRIAKVIEHITATILSYSSLSEAVIVLRLLSKMMDNRSIMQMLLTEGKLLNKLCKGLTYPDTASRLVSLDIFIELLQFVQELSTQSIYLNHTLPSLNGLSHHLVQLLQTSDESSLLLRSIKVLGSATFAMDFSSWIGPGKKSNDLVVGLKRCLLKRGEEIRSEVIGCLILLLGHHPSVFPKKILQADIIEFVYDTLKSTSSPNLKMSIFCVIHLLFDCETFWTGCYATYGVDSALRATKDSLENNNHDVAANGLMLLEGLLQNCTPERNILHTISLFDRSLEVANIGIKSKVIKVVESSVDFSSALFRDYLQQDFTVLFLIDGRQTPGTEAVLAGMIKPIEQGQQHLPHPIPYKDLLKIHSCLMGNLHRFMPVTSQNTSDDNSQSSNSSEHLVEECSDKNSVVTKLMIGCWSLLKRLTSLAVEQHNEENHSEDLKLFSSQLTATITEFWIPLILRSKAALLCPLVLQPAICTLALLCELPMSRITPKLVKNGFCGLSLKLKTRFFKSQPHSELVESCTEFLYQVNLQMVKSIICLSVDKCLEDILSVGFKYLQGHISELPKLLEKHCGLDGFGVNNQTLAVQCAVISTLFTEFWNGKRSSLIVAVKNSLDFHCSIHGNLQHLPSVIQQMIFFLYSVHYCDCNEAPNVPESLVHSMLSTTKVIRHIAVLALIVKLQMPNISEWQEERIYDWLSVENEENSPKKTLSMLCLRYESAGVLVINSLLHCKDDEVQEKLLEVVRVTLQLSETSDDESANNFAQFLSTAVFDIAYNQLSGTEGDECNIRKIELTLELVLLSMTNHSSDTSNNSKNVRLLRLVLHQAAVSDENATRARVISLQLVKVMMSNAKETDSPELLLAIFSHEKFLKMMQNVSFDKLACEETGLLNEDDNYLCHLSLSLLAKLVKLQKEYSQKTQSILTANELKLANATCMNNCIELQIALLSLWSSLFSVKFDTELIRIERPLLDGSAISTLSFKMIWSSALSAAVQSYPDCKSVGHSCLLEMLKFSCVMDKNSSWFHHLVHHPWLEFVLSLGRSEKNRKLSWLESWKQLDDFVKGWKMKEYSENKVPL